MLDFNTIYETVKPYVGTSTIALIVATLVVGIIFFKKVIKNVNVEISLLSSKMSNIIGKALPKDITISLEALSEKAFNDMTEKFEKIIQEKFIDQIKANTEITKTIAEALAVSRLTPDEYKEKIKALLDIKEEVPTAESLKISLLTPEVEKIEEKKVINDFKVV